jgi:hypothetical protein
MSGNTALTDFLITAGYATWLFGWVMGSVLRDARRQLGASR